HFVYSRIRELFGGNLTGVISGGAPLSPEVSRFINAVGLYCGQGYGMTETSPVIAAQDPEHMRLDSSGLPLDGVEVRIADDQEILVRGPNVMKGYYNDPERTREVIDSDGWLATGDVGRLDEDGYLFVTDRKKDLFKLSTGKYVAPQNIETKLSDSSFIDQAVVTGYQKKYCTALIVPAYENVLRRLKRNEKTPKEPYREDEYVQSLIQHEVDKANRDLSPWETVKRFYLLEEPLRIETGELTPTMKVKRNVVNKRYAEQIESMYEDDDRKEEEGSSESAEALS
ncbi:MAG: AMP-binding protein, partial [Balneolaceae bacterium]